MKQYEIWLGWYHLGQGSHSPTKPEKVATVEANSFKAACLLYEYTSHANFLVGQMKKGENVTNDVHFGLWCYEPKNNSNSWTGAYYETEEEAQESINQMKSIYKNV